MSSNKAFRGVSECYAFKSRLQEYAQKVGFVTPVYQTVMEGPSHAPAFKSTVIVNEVRYDSLPGACDRNRGENVVASEGGSRFLYGELSELDHVGWIDEGGRLGIWGKLDSGFGVSLSMDSDSVLGAPDFCR